MMFVGLTLLFTLFLVGLSITAIWLAYRLTWRGQQRWMEMTRHQNRLALIVGRWIWFKWAHIDCQYWILHLDFSAGPIELRGSPPTASYWSFTYNTWSEVNPSINSETVQLDADGSYRIVYSREQREGNWIQVRPHAKLGVVYFRIYESPADLPSDLPEVWQNDQPILRRAMS